MWSTDRLRQAMNGRCTRHSAKSTSCDEPEACDSSVRGGRCSVRTSSMLAGSYAPDRGYRVPSCPPRAPDRSDPPRVQSAEANGRRGDADRCGRRLRRLRRSVRTFGRGTHRPLAGSPSTATGGAAVAHQPGITHVPCPRNARRGCTDSKHAPVRSVCAIAIDPALADAVAWCYPRPTRTGRHRASWPAPNGGAGEGERRGLGIGRGQTTVVRAVWRSRSTAAPCWSAAASGSASPRRAKLTTSSAPNAMQPKTELPGRT